MKGPQGTAMRIVIGILGIGGVLVLLFQFATMLDMTRFSEEARTLFPQHRYADARLFADDSLAEALQQQPEPLFYGFINRFWLETLGLDLIHYHHGLAIILYAIALCGFWGVGKAVGGRAGAAFALLTVVLHTELLYGISSGRAQGFAYPVLILFLLAMLHGRTGWMAAITILAGGLYQPVAVVCGLAFAAHLLFSTGKQAGKPRWLWTLWLLGGVGTVTLMLVVSTLDMASLFGQKAVLSESLKGVDFSQLATTNRYILWRMIHQYGALPTALKLMLVLYTFLLMGVGFWSLSASASARQRLALFWLAAFGSWLLCTMIAPGYAYRLMLYPTMVLVPVLLPLGLARLSGGSAAKLLLLVWPVLLIQHTNPAKIGYEYTVNRQTLESVANITHALPPETMFAGWPGNHNTMNELFPYLFKRPVFVMYKGYHPLNAAYGEQLLQRMRVLIDAYFAQDKAPLLALRDQWGVDYLIVRKAHFLPEAEPIDTRYYLGFEEELERKLTGLDMSSLFLANPPAATMVYEDDAYCILRLADL